MSDKSKGDFHERGSALIAGGYLIVPIKPGTKEPAGNRWQDARFSAHDLANYPSHGVGVLTGQGDCPLVAIDVDISHPTIGPAVVEWCRRNIGETCERMGAAPRILLVYRSMKPGWRKATSAAFFDQSDPLKLNGKRNEQRIEVLGDGQQFVAYSIHPDTHKPYDWTDLFGGIAHVPAESLPVVTVEQIGAMMREVDRLVQSADVQIVADASASTGARDDAGALMSLMPTLGLDGAKIASLLAELPNDLDYDTFLSVGMAVHHETAGAGFDLWHDWSKRSPKYTTQTYYRDRWQSFGSYTSGPVKTMASVIKMANECITRRKYEAARQQKQRIADCADEFTLREKVCAEIARDSMLGDMERESLAQLLCDRFKALGTKYPIAQCRKLIAERRASQHDGDAPEWAAPWVYVTDRDQFFRRDSDEWLSRQSFNAAYNRLLPKNDTGHVLKNASDLALEDYEVPYATRGIYLPWAGEMFELHGVKCVNTYRPSSVPRAVERLSVDGQHAVDMVLRHVHMLASGRREVIETLVAWLAHNVQKPGVKIRWAPLIKGVEGDGKTLLGSLLAASMGHANVKQISPKVLGTDFTDWAHGACVGVLEEIKLTGHNRHDILNALKPFITNDSIAVHPKGLAEYNVVNTQNYLAFTNHSDALPLSDTDRRWYIVFTPFATTSALTDAIAAMGTDVAYYFNGLYHAISTQCAELRRWLLDYPLTGFEPNGSAPHTREKNLMVGMSASPEEELLREVIAEGAEGVTSAVLSSASLVKAAQISDPAVTLQTNTLNRLLVRLGWQKVGRLKWNGQPHRIWVKGSVPNDNESVRAILDATLPVGAISTESAARLFDSVPDSVPGLSPL